MGVRFGKHPCIQLNNNLNPKEFDLGLAGAKGEIWANGDGAYKCFRILRNGDEQIHYFGAEDLDKWVRLLEIPRDPVEQAEIANSR